MRIPCTVQSNHGWHWSRRRIFNAKIVLLVAANRVIIEAALCTTDLETREYRLTRTTIVRQMTTIVRGALFNVNVDYTTGSETELSGERTGDQVNALHPVGINFLAEPGDPLRNQDVINTKLEVSMFATDVELPIRILGYSRHPQNDLIERSIRTLRLRLNLFLTNAVSGSAKIRHDLWSRASFSWPITTTGFSSVEEGFEFAVDESIVV